MTLPQPLKFLLVGAGGYAVNLGAFAALVESRTPYVAASVTAYFLSNALMYLGNRYFTFRLGHEGVLAAYARYSATGVLVAALNAALLTLLVEAIGLAPTLGQALSLLLLTPVAFVLNRRWTFRVATA
jgi:putative flippase GtrA